MRYIALSKVYIVIKNDFIMAYSVYGARHFHKKTQLYVWEYVTSQNQLFLWTFVDVEVPGTSV